MNRIALIALAALMTLSAIGCSQEVVSEDVGSTSAAFYYERFDSETGERTLEITAPCPVDGVFYGVELAYFDGEEETVVVTDLGEGIDPSPEAARLLATIDYELQEQIEIVRAIYEGRIVPLGDAMAPSPTAATNLELVSRVGDAFPNAMESVSVDPLDARIDWDCMAATGSFYECLYTVGR